MNCQNGKSVKANRVGFYNVLTSRGDEGGFRVGRYVSNIDSYSVLESDGHQSCPDSFLECHDYTQKSEFPNIVKGYLGKRGSIMQDGTMNSIYDGRLVLETSSEPRSRMNMFMARTD